MLQDNYTVNDDETAAKLINKMHAAHKLYIDDKNSSSKKAAYLRTKSEVQRNLRQMKENWWSKKAKEIQAAADSHNLKAFFDGLNGIFGPSKSKTSPIESKDGQKVFTEESVIINRWAEHFKGVLNQDSNVDWTVLNSIPQQPMKEILKVCLRHQRFQPLPLATNDVINNQ